jgi:hypothetical protein
MKSVVLFVTSTYPSLMARRTIDQSLCERSPQPLGKENHGRLSGPMALARAATLSS